MRFVLVDNYDSFTFNLFQLLAELNGEAPLLLRNDDLVSWPALRAEGYGAIVVSPGPGRPERARDFGISASAIVDSGMAVLGVCLGHQGLCHLHGAPVVPAPEPMHGRTSAVHHAQIDLFEGIPSPFEVVRYHSLAVGELPAGPLRALAWSDDGVLMGVRHHDAPLWGVQFHPESICSEHGARLLRNFRDLALAAAVRGRTRGDEQRLVRRQPVVRWRRLALALDPEVVFADLYAEREVAFWLDSSATIPGYARFSFMGDDRGPLAEVVTYDVASGRVTIRTADGTEQADGPLLTYLDDQVRARRTTTSALPFDFNGGYVGWLGYELKAECGGEAAHRSAAPDAAFLFADRFLAFDHETGDVWLVALEAHDAPAAPWLGATGARLTALARSRGANGNGRSPVPALAADALEGGRAVAVEDAWPAGCTPRHDDDAYLALIARCQEAITAGETYEVCLTNALELDGAVDPWEAYRRLRRLNPAPFAAFLRFPRATVLSASPERFLRVGADGEVEAKPIKGTAPRGASVESDLAIRERLRTSEKDRAENLMIVDLLRNDLGAVCEVGSVHVPVLFGVESFATVHQLVSTIRGRIGRGSSALDVVRAAFPGGSMTGAPKRRTMEIVDELEAGPRGVYSGALGWFALGGAADLSIVIRTIVVTEEGASFGAGGAIVALSDPQQELREVRLKARALVETLLPAQEPAISARRR